MPAYRFRAVTVDDLPLLHKWLSEPHIDGWWDSADDWISKRDENSDLGSPLVDRRIVELENTPIAYVQDYDAHYCEMPQYNRFPTGTRAVDTFLGDPNFLGMGHGAGYMRARALGLLASGCPAVVIDPDPENIRAVRAYRAAGFIDVEITACEDDDPVLVMEFKKD